MQGGTQQQGEWMVVAQRSGRMDGGGTYCAIVTCSDTSHHFQVSILQKRIGLPCSTVRHCEYIYCVQAL